MTVTKSNERSVLGKSKGSQFIPLQHAFIPLTVLFSPYESLWALTIPSVLTRQRGETVLSISLRLASPPPLVTSLFPSDSSWPRPSLCPSICRKKGVFWVLCLPASEDRQHKNVLHILFMFPLNVLATRGVWFAISRYSIDLFLSKILAVEQTLKL